MAKPPSPLTPQELAIMKIVWQRGAVTVRDVYEALRARRQVAYTTVMTMMNVLEGKGYLRRSLEAAAAKRAARSRKPRAAADAAGARRRPERAYTYRPTRPERVVLGAMVREFVHRVFDGAAHSLMLHLVKGGRLTDEERRELRRLIDEGGR